MADFWNPTGFAFGAITVRTALIRRAVAGADDRRLQPEDQQNVTHGSYGFAVPVNATSCPLPSRTTLIAWMQVLPGA